MSQLLGLRGAPEEHRASAGGWNGFGMAAGSFAARGLMQSQSDAQLPICRLLKNFRDLSEREDLLEFQ